MRIYIILLCVQLYTLVVPVFAIAQSFTSLQKAWLYKIVDRTPSLKRNWNTYFVYNNGDVPIEKKRIVVNGDLSICYVPQYKLIEERIVENPDLLNVDWEAISKTSPGLLADAAVKLTLWELYSNIKQGFDEDPKFSENKTAKYFYDEIFKVLPAGMRKGMEIKKRYLSVFYDLINPSLNIGKKTESFSSVNNVSVQGRKKVFDKWHRLVIGYVNEKSKEYFNVLCQRKVYFAGHLLAAGEGSGSSGLLHEFEETEGGGINTGTGKGIGLFTYSMKVKKDRLISEFESEAQVKPLKNESTLLHLSLWGIDGEKKPLIVVEQMNKSYLLFGGVEFSPDPDFTPGLSYLDRIDEFRAEKIDRLIKELNKEGGLLSIYEKERKLRDKIQAQIDRVNLEIDSLKELGDVNEKGIQQRLRRNEVNLSNLTDKSKRLSDLEVKISAYYKKIDKAEKELEEMKTALGEDVQEWTSNESIYTFSDGTVFNANTQDLILYTDSNATRIKVKLLAASYSLFIDKIDEVQLYVNVTGGVIDGADEKVVGRDEVVSQDVLVRRVCYFESDEFGVVDVFDAVETKRLAGVMQKVKDGKKELVTTFVAHGIDTVIHTSLDKDKINYQKNKSLDKFKESRRVEVEVVEYKNRVEIYVSGYTDAGNTHLSKLEVGQRAMFKACDSVEQSLNPVLSALRVKYVLSEIEDITEYDFSTQTIYIQPLKTEFSISDF